MGKSEYTDPDGVCIITGRIGITLHHVRTRGAGGPDEPWNLMPIAQEKHVEVHVLGLGRFAARYSPVQDWLFKNGWRFDSVYKRWVHTGGDDNGNI